MWIIQATVTKQKYNGWRESTQLPTFFLDKDIQGIVDEKHAARIAEKLINPFCDETITVSIGAYFDDQIKTPNY